MIVKKKSLPFYEDISVYRGTSFVLLDCSVGLNMKRWPRTEFEDRVWRTLTCAT